MPSAARFLLLVLVQFSSSVVSLPPDVDVNNDTEALLAFKNSLANSRSLATWKEGSQPCKDGWVGVFCIKGQDTVIRLHLPLMGLSGSIDVNALSQIYTLRTISLINNSFTGSLPPFNSITSLRALYLSGNQFSGGISDDFFAGMDSLTRLWLSNNNLRGNIPRSLGKLPRLAQLHLEKNQFSGGIPDISQKWVSDLDMSNNKLEGRIPDSMARFGGKAFGGNSRVCGKAVGLECKQPAPKGKAAGSTSTNTTTTTTTTTTMATTVDLLACIAVVMLILLLLNIGFKPKVDDDDDKEDDHNAPRAGADQKLVLHVKDNNIDQLSAAGTAGNYYNYDKKKLGDDQGNVSRKGIADLVVINEDKGVFGFADLMKAAAEVLGNGGLGSAYKAVMDNGVSVVVKRIKFMNNLGKEAFDAHMRSIVKIRHPNILTPLAYHYRREEKLIISECISKGSLLYVMHGDRGASHTDLNWVTRLRILKGIVSGMKCLHHQFAFLDLPHGNLKSSNVLLNDKYEPLINDHAFFPCLPVSQAREGMFAFKTPEALKTNQVSPKSDVYCVGIIILEVITGKFPSQYLNGGKGGTNVIQWVQSAIHEGKEADLLDPEIASCSSIESIKNMVKLLHLGAKCTGIDPQQRPAMEEIAKTMDEIEA